MRTTIAIATGLLIGTGTTAVGAALTIPGRYYGSDTLFQVTQDALGANPTVSAGDTNLAAGQASQYLGGGSGTGQGAMGATTALGASQQTAPMGKLFTNAVCGTSSVPVLGGSNGSGLTNATGVVIGLDAIDVLASNTNGASSACSSPGSPTGTTATPDGLAFSGTTGIFAAGNTGQNWKWILALLYGGLDLSTPNTLPDCNSATRRALVANWSKLFQNGCASSPSVCNDATHASGGTAALWHAFRRDDQSAASDLFSQLLGLQALMPANSASSNSGFGASPFCNALNWDTNTSNNGSDLNICVLGNNDQFTGPAGIPDPASLCVSTGFKAASLKVPEACMGGTCVIGGTGALACPGSSSCNTPSDIGNVLGATCTTAADCRTGVDQNNASVTWTCTAGACALATPATGIAGICSANACSTTNACGFGFTCNIPSGQTQGTCQKTCSTSAECGNGFLCNTATGQCAGNHRRTPKGAYGDTPVGATAIDVLPTSFQDNDPIRRPCLGNTAGNAFKSGEEVCNTDGNLGLVLSIPTSDFIPQQLGKLQYPATACTTFKLGKPPKIFNCAPFNAALGTRSGECPNGDFKLTGGACYGPIAPGNSQCLNGFANHSPVHSGTIPSSYDGRRHNLHMYDGNVTGLLTYLQDSIQNGKSTPPTVDFVGGMGRIHQTQTVWDTTALVNPPNVGCQELGVDDQLACLAQADPCSFAYAGDGSKSWANRQPSPNTLCTQFDVNNGGPCTPAGGPFTGGAGCPPACLVNPVVTADSLRIDGVYPNAPTAQAFGNPHATFQEYQVTRKLYFASLVGFPNIILTGDTADPSGAGELDLAQWESSIANIGPILDAVGFFRLGAQSPNGATDTPFCEDFNQQVVCNPSPASASTLPANDNACGRNLTPIPSDPSTNAATATRSTVCGNGVQEAFEECDHGLNNGTTGDSCSQVCRCANNTSSEPLAGGGFGCQ